MSRLFTVHDPNPRVGLGSFRNLTGRVGLDRAADRVRRFLKLTRIGSGRVTLTRPDPTLSDPRGLIQPVNSPRDQP